MTDVTKLNAAGWIALREDVAKLKKVQAEHVNKLREHGQQIDSIKMSVAQRFSELAEAFREHNELLRLLIDEVRLDRGH